MLSLIAGLFSFIAYGTLGWATEKYTVSGVCTTDNTLYLGLYEYLQRAETNCAGDSSTSENTEDLNCDVLDDSQCDYLTNAQNAAGTAVAGSTNISNYIITVI